METLRATGYHCGENVSSPLGHHLDLNEDLLSFELLYRDSLDGTDGVTGPAPFTQGRVYGHMPSVFVPSQGLIFAHILTEATSGTYLLIY
jgi:hypothetical protein